MKNFISIFSFAVVLFHLNGLVNSAFADLVKAVDIHADYFPDTQYEIDLDLNADHSIQRIFFVQDQNKTPFDLNDLSNFQSLIHVFGQDAVLMRIVSSNQVDQAVIELSYMQSIHNYATMQVSVSYNKVAGHYDITDLRDHRVITKVLVHTRYNFLRIPVGIASIETQ